jgi:hypothetical protein
MTTIAEEVSKGKALGMQYQNERQAEEKMQNFITNSMSRFYGNQMQ